MHNYLMKVISLFNFNNINFEVIGLDLFVDVNKPFKNMFAFCNKKVGECKILQNIRETISFWNSLHREI